MCAQDQSRGRRWSGSGEYMLVLLVPVQGGGTSCYIDYDIGADADDVGGVH